MSGGPGRRLRDLAVFVRSKNAGPFTLTIDLFFPDAATCQAVRDSGVLAPERVASLYGVDPAVVRLIHVPQAHALKVSLPRPHPAGDPGDADVAGGQQFLPLLGLEIPTMSAPQRPPEEPVQP